MNISSIDLVIVISYIVVIIFYGIWKSRNVHDSADFLVAGRSLGLFVLISTLVMTEFNTATMVGFSSFGYKAGFYSQLILLASFIGFMAYTFIVAKRWKRINATSIIELFEIRYNKSFRLLTTFMIVILLLFFSPAYLRAVGLIFASSLGISLTTTVIIISITVLIFSVIGGLTAVAHTNTLSFILTLVALPLMWYFTREHAISLGGIEQVFEEKYLSINPVGMWNDPQLPFSFILSTYFLLFLIYMQSPWYAQLMTAAKNEKVAYASMGIGAVLIVFVYAFSIQVAAYVKVGFPDLTDPQLALAMAINNWLPVGISGLLLAVIIAIGQTTMGTIWNNIVSITSNDIYKRIMHPDATEKKLLRFSRIMTLAIALFTIIVSITIVDQVINTLFVGNIIMASLFFPALGGFLWWKTGEKAVWITTVISIVSGFGLLLVINQTSGYDLNDWMFFYYVIICPAIILIGIIISYFEKPSEEYLLKKVRFFNKVGAPWFGKKEYHKYLEYLN
ncbi:sodium:solute symporter family protein [Mariniphaga sediminis]|uniref:sodium:solute symporter family protein n=1 Tax=Mariniphaga sediminis TaxID=1628158 RepID=UPI0035687646